MLRRNKEMPCKSSTLFASYLANMNAVSSGAGLYKLRGDALSDNMKVDTLVKEIGAECSWSDVQMDSDIIVLLQNRIYTVKELRILSRESWKKIELLPIVKDLLRDIINRGRVSLDEDFAEKSARMKSEKRLSREILGSRDIKRAMDNKNNIIKEMPVVSKKQRDEVVAPLTYDEKKSLTQPVGPPVEQPKLFLPSPNKIVIGDRMKVKTSNGKIYEVDRLCPHAKSDLSTRGVVIGSKLFCTKHCLSYDLENGGACTSKHQNITINACPINDW